MPQASAATAAGRGQGGVVRNVQVLRAASALLVIVAHLDKLLESVGLFPKGRLGVAVFGAAVAIFFTISGFIMVHTTATRPTTPWDFMANRIVRIVPIYWAVTLVLAAAVFLAPAVAQATRASWGELFDSLAFIPFAKANGQVEPLLFVGWTLNYEMFFYLVFAMGLALRPRLAGSLAVITALAWLVLLGALFQPQSVLGKFYTNSLMLEFVLGMLVALAVPHLPASRRGWPKPAASLVLLAGIAGAILLPYEFTGAAPVLVSGLPAMLIVGGAVALDRQGWSIRNRLLLLLGDASYSLYLTHAFITGIAEKIGARLHAQGAAALLLMALAIAAACIVAILVFRTVERPLWQIARRNLLPRPIPVPAA